MQIHARGPTLAVAGAAMALAGCPPLDVIGVGDAGPSADAPADVRADRPPEASLPESGPSDAKSEATACTKDLDTDPKNCGRCGHDCMEGDCAGGACQPYAIVTGNQGPWGVAVNAGIVYFTSIDNTIEKCRADKCSNSLVQMTANQRYPKTIVTDATNVYWGNAGFFVEGGIVGGVSTCGLAGCPSGNATVLAPDEAWPEDVAVDANSVYWTDTFGSAVRSCSVAGCLDKPTTLATDPTVLSGVAVDATSIYWAEPKLGNIIQCPLSGCGAIVPFASGQMSPAKLLVALGTLYWSTSDAIMSCPTSGCSPEPVVFAKKQTSAYALARDADTLYWTTYTNDAMILSCLLSGCAKPTVLATHQRLPTSVAVDDTSVYWANSGADSVMRVIK